MSDVISKIPSKTQNGIFNHDVCLTCIDVLPEFLALGSDVGIVYWYDRKKKYMQRLRCENPHSRVVVVKVISTVDYMVACGNYDGQISIFQIPKSHPDSLPESLKPKQKQVERYTVSDLHTSPITSLEWSKNGMKLFSGDKSGLIVLTEIDFYMHLSKSVDILNEAYEVVQLSYCQQHLLISTAYRTIICQKQDKWKVCQVGKKDRKSLGQYGGVFKKNGLKPKDISIYCTRPGLRIWISDLEGTVQQTLLFKDLLNKECFEVPLINPITGYIKKLKPHKEAQFGILIPFADNLLVTYSSEVIYILDPANLLVIATVSHLRRIISISASKEELFILEGERSLIRISFKPEPVFNDNSTNAIPTASTFLPLTNSLKDLTSKFQTSSIISALPPLFESNLPTNCNIHTDSTTIVNAEEALELSPVKKFPGNNLLKIYESNVVDDESKDDVRLGQECIDLKKETAKKFEIYEKIGAEEFDDHILFKHRRRKKNNLNKSELNASATSLSSSSSEDRDSQVNRPCMLNVSTVGTLAPDLRSPDSILTDIESKEKILADMLKLETIKFPLEVAPLETDTQNKTNETENKFLSNYIIEKSPFEQLNAHTNGIKNKKIENNILVESRQIENFSRIQNHKANRDVKVQSHDSNYFHQEFAPPSTANRNNYFPKSVIGGTLNYGPPSGSSNPNSIDPPACLIIPNIWKLQELTVNPDASENSDNSLCDWEII